MQCYAANCQCGQSEWNNNADTVLLVEKTCVFVCMLKLQQAAVPLQSAVPAAGVISSRPVEQYVPPSDTYWARTGLDHSYHSSQSHSQRSVFLERVSLM